MNHKVLVACEKSQAVTKAFRALGFEAYSCDVQDCTGGHPEWHIKGDALEQAYSGEYRLMVAHPPCTYLSKAGARWMYPTKGVLNPDRYKLAMEGKKFFMSLLEAPIPFKCLENPTPLKVCELPKHTQSIQPYQFGHPYSKRTNLWLVNLPPLIPTEIVEEYTPFVRSNTSSYYKGGSGSKGAVRGGERLSVTFQGIADAMADQWSKLI
jgi:hypothetical protein